MTIQKATFFTLAVVTVHLVAVVIGLYWIWQWFDVPMHFAGGFAVGMLGLSIWQRGVVGLKAEKQLQWWLAPMFIVGFVSFIGIGWEIYEFFMDSFFNAQINAVYQFVRQPSIGDTIFDLVFDIFGGAAAILIIRR